MPTDLVGSPPKHSPKFYLDLDLIMIGANLPLMQEEKDRGGVVSSFPHVFGLNPDGSKIGVDGKALVDPGPKVNHIIHGQSVLI